jgi:hypothetical protein
MFVDDFIAMLRLYRSALILSSLPAALGWLGPSPARACSAIEPGIFSRSMFPRGGATGIPTNVRVVVRYGARNYGVPVDAGDPGIGTDLELRSRAGVPVAVSRITAVSGKSHYLGEEVVVLTPTQPLAPATEYEVVDRRPNIPCGPNRPMSCALGAVTVVGAFTTGAGPSTEAPAGPTGARLIEGMFSHCNSSSCCGPYLVKRFEARWDEAAAGTRLYNVYAGTPQIPLVRYLDGSQLNLAVGCAGGSGDPNALWVTPGSVSVRAVDQAGNEGPAVELGTIPANVCADAPTAGVDFPPEPSGVDAAIDAHDAGGEAVTGVDTAPDAGSATPDARLDSAVPGSDVASPAPRTSSGGGCQVGGSPGAALSALPLALLLAAAGLARRRQD